MRMRQPILYALIALNTAIVGVREWVPFTPMLTWLQAIFGGACIVLAYIYIRSDHSSLSRDLLLLASVFLLPLFLLLVSIGAALCFSERSDLRYLIAMPALSAYYWIPSSVGIAYLLLASLLLIFAWRYRVSLTLWHKAVLVAYTSALLVYIGYVTWWYVTLRKPAYF